MHMVLLIGVFLLSGGPVVDVEIPLPPGTTAMGCMLGGQPSVAAWLGEHPLYGGHGWKCVAVRARQRDA